MGRVKVGGKGRVKDGKKGREGLKFGLKGEWWREMKLKGKGG